MSKRNIIISIAATGVVLFGASLVYAENNNGIEFVSHDPIHTLQQTVTINNRGEGQLRGSVVSITSTTIGVQTWGGIWSISMSSTTIVQDKNQQSIQFSAIKSGDQVIVKGIANNTSLSFLAQGIHDISQTLPSNKFLYGTVSNVSVSNGTFTLTAENVSKSNKVYQVTVPSNVSIFINAEGKSEPLADIGSGVKVRVWGVVDENTNTQNAVRISELVHKFYQIGTIGAISSSTNSFSFSTNNKVVNVVFSTHSHYSVANLIQGNVFRVAGWYGLDDTSVVASGVYPIHIKQRNKDHILPSSGDEKSKNNHQNNTQGNN